MEEGVEVRGYNALVQRRSDPTIFRIKDAGGKTVVRPDALGKLTGSAGLPKMLESLRGPRRQSEICPLCGWTADQYLKTRLLGCGLCHTVFQELIADKQGIDQE